MAVLWSIVDDIMLPRIKSEQLEFNSNAAENKQHLARIVMDTPLKLYVFLWFSFSAMDGHITHVEPRRIWQHHKYLFT